MQSRSIVSFIISIIIFTVIGIIEEDSLLYLLLGIPEIITWYLIPLFLLLYSIISGLRLFKENRLILFWVIPGLLILITLSITWSISIYIQSRENLQGCEIRYEKFIDIRDDLNEKLEREYRTALTFNKMHDVVRLSIANKTAVSLVNITTKPIETDDPVNKIEVCIKYRSKRKKIKDLNEHELMYELNLLNKLGLKDDSLAKNPEIYKKRLWEFIDFLAMEYSKREHYALRKLENIRILNQDGKIQLNRILNAHKNIFKSNFVWAGQYRTVCVQTDNSGTTTDCIKSVIRFDYDYMEDISKNMDELLRQWNYQIVNVGNMTQLEKFQLVSEFHYRFEQIHPFLDGNGRIGRHILNEQIKYLFNKKCDVTFWKDEYYNAMWLYDYGDEWILPIYLMINYGQCIPDGLDRNEKAFKQYREDYSSEKYIKKQEISNKDNYTRNLNNVLKVLNNIANIKLNEIKYSDYMLKDLKLRPEIKKKVLDELSLIYNTELAEYLYESDISINELVRFLPR